MARTTVDDCLSHCSNHFELVLAVSDRARRLKAGEHSILSSPRQDRPIVQALREIASGELSISAIRESEDEQAGSDFLDEGKEDKDYQYPDDDSSETKT